MGLGEASTIEMWLGTDYSGNKIKVSHDASAAGSLVAQNGTVPSQNLFNDEKASLDTLVGDAVPHHARLAGVDGMPELDHLAGVQGRVVMDGAKPALAVIEQAAADFLVRGIAEGELQ